MLSPSIRFGQWGEVGAILEQLLTRSPQPAHSATCHRDCDRIDTSKWKSRLATADHPSLDDEGGGPLVSGPTSPSFSPPYEGGVFVWGPQFLLWGREGGAQWSPMESNALAVLCWQLERVEREGRGVWIYK